MRQEKQSFEGVERKVYKAFVSGLPWRVSNQELRLFFQSLGSFEVESSEKFKELHNPQLPTKTSPRSTFCVVSTKDLQSYCRLLENDSLIFRGRQLIASKYRSGLDLVLFNNRLTKRKAVLIGVPQKYTMEQVKLHLEKTLGGKVQHINKLVGRLREDKNPINKSDQPTKEASRSQTFNYSVTFQHITIVKKFLQSGSILFDDVSVQVKKFKKIVSKAECQEEQPPSPSIGSNPDPYYQHNSLRLATESKNSDRKDSPPSCEAIPPIFNLQTRSSERGPCCEMSVHNHRPSSKFYFQNRPFLRQSERIQEGLRFNVQNLPLNSFRKSSGSH